MEDRFIVPNYHVILIHYPLGLLILGTMIELLAFLWRRSAVRVGARWMILLGALSMIPAVTSGMYALQDVERTSDAQWELLNSHVWQQSFATGIAVIVVVVWTGSSDRLRRKLHWPGLALLTMSVALSIAGAWHGGEAVYRHGTGVGTIESEPPVATAKARRGLSFLLPPLEGHLLLSGMSMAVAMGALGMSYRRVTRTRELDRLADEAALAASTRGRTMPPSASDSRIVRSINSEAPAPTDDTPPTPATRLWLAAAFLALATVFFGYWYLAASTDAWATAVDRVGRRANTLDRVHAYLRELIEMVFGRNVRTKRIEFPRRAFHVANGIVLVVLMGLMAGLARWGKRRTGPLTFLALLLLLALAAQVWVGTLMLYESPDGSLTGWTK